MTDFIAEVICGLAAGEAVTVATVIGPEGVDAGVLGRKLVIAHNGEVHGTLGSASIDKQVAQEVESAAGKGATPCLVTYPLPVEERAQLDLAMSELEFFIEVLVPAPTLLIAGGGHIAVPLCMMGKALGFRVVVLDDRPDFASRERFPEADQVIAGSFSELLSQFPIGISSYVVIITRGHANDEEALRAVLESDAAYIGMIGSSRKVKTIMDRVRESGVPQEQLDRVYSPIGLDIAAETPAEIALSILAEIVHVRRCGDPHPSSMKLTGKKGLRAPAGS